MLITSELIYVQTLGIHSIRKARRFKIDGQLFTVSMIWNLLAVLKHCFFAQEIMKCYEELIFGISMAMTEKFCLFHRNILLLVLAIVSVYTMFGLLFENLICKIIFTIGYALFVFNVLTYLYYVGYLKNRKFSSNAYKFMEKCLNWITKAIVWGL